jgi:NhaA family Na+:H+ antiporter
MAERSPFARGVLLPAESVMHSQAVSGAALLVASVAALVWANSPWSPTYLSLRETELSIDFGFVGLSLSLHHWINDGLMTLFFFAVGLEIKREVLHGELNAWKKASLPIFGALGGMFLPAALYLGLTLGGEGGRGWGIPVATDIAFALGLLALLGDRVPSELRIFLLALATVDDIGAILVIALFYTDSLSVLALGWAAALFATVLLLQRLGVRSGHYYAVVGAGFWMALQQAGVHPTIGGVLLGLATPATPWFSYRRFAESGRDLIHEFTRRLDRGDEERADALLGRIEELARETEAPLERLERLLQPWIGFVVLPLFALANAGVTLSGASLEQALRSPIAQGIIVGLVLGKCAGIVTVSWLAVRAGAAALPSGVGWRHIVGVGLAAGIGFTVSLFITGLAFQGAAGEEAKIGILLASLLSGTAGYVCLRSVGARSTGP